MQRVGDLFTATGIGLASLRVLGPQAECRQGFVGLVGSWGMGVFLGVGGKSVGGEQLATRPQARSRYEFFARPAAPADAAMASM